VESIIENVNVKFEKGNIDVLFIDYFQLLKTSDHFDNKNKKLTNCLMKLKAFAVKENVAVILSSQIEVAVDRIVGDHRPYLRHIQGAVEAENIFDLVFHIYTPYFYGITEDYEGNSTKGLTEIIVCKNKRGSLGNIPLYFVSGGYKFENWERGGII
jgi:replicative DNA helicase